MNGRPSRGVVDELEMCKSSTSRRHRWLLESWVGISRPYLLQISLYRLRRLLKYKKTSQAVMVIDNEKGFSCFYEHVYIWIDSGTRGIYW